MPPISPQLLAIAAGGAALAAGLGAMTGAGLRIPPPDMIQPTPAIDVGFEEIGFASAPAYPAWAPPPLYPEAERDPYEEFMAAWDRVMDDFEPRATPAHYAPPADLPPPYEVRVETRGHDLAYKDSEPYPVRRRWEPEPLGPRDLVYVERRPSPPVVMPVAGERPRGAFY